MIEHVSDELELSGEQRQMLEEVLAAMSMLIVRSPLYTGKVKEGGFNQLF